MRHLLKIIIMIVLVPSLGWAQENSETKQILQLLQGMDGRFDKIEQRLDEVEGEQTAPSPPERSPSPPPPSPSPSTPTSAMASAPPAGVAVPGWKINVFPLTDGGTAPAPIARTRAPIGITYFNLHLDGGPVSNLVNYHGEAYFWAKESGTYTFNIYFDNSNSGSSSLWPCSLYLKIEDETVIEKFSSNRPRTMSGIIDLAEGKYLISYDVDCYYENRGSSSNRDTAGQTVVDQNELDESYKKISYNIKLISPSDVSMRDFEPDELFFIAPPPRLKSGKQTTLAPRAVDTQKYEDEEQERPAEAPTQASVQPEMPPEEAQPRAIRMDRDGITTRIANLRTEPRRTAASPYQLTAGSTLRVMQMVGAWYQVQTRSGDVGFVHSSLVALREQ